MLRLLCRHLFGGGIMDCGLLVIIPSMYLIWIVIRPLSKNQKNIMVSSNANANAITQCKTKYTTAKVYII